MPTHMDREMHTENSKAKQVNAPIKKMILRRPAMGGDMITTRFTMEHIRWLQAEAKRLDRPVSWVVRKAVINAMDAAEEERGRVKKQ